VIDSNRSKVLASLQTFRANGASITQVAAVLHMFPTHVAGHIAELVAAEKAFDITEPSSPVKRFRAIRREMQP
jgi:hypothetical protein